MTTSKTFRERQTEHEKYVEALAADLANLRPVVETTKARVLDAANGSYKRLIQGRENELLNGVPLPVPPEKMNPSGS